jgi:hypothetical protein
MTSEAKQSDTALADAELAEQLAFENHISNFKKLSFEDQRKEWLQTDPEMRNKMKPNLGKELNKKLRTVSSVASLAKQFGERQKTQEYINYKSELDLKELNTQFNKLSKEMADNPNNLNIVHRWNELQMQILFKNDSFIKRDEDTLKSEEDELYEQLKKGLEDADKETNSYKKSQIINKISDNYNKYLRRAGVHNPGGINNVKKRFNNLAIARTNFIKARIRLEEIKKAEEKKKKEEEKKEKAVGGATTGGVKFGGNIHTLSSIREDEPESNMSRQILKEGGF